MDGWSFQLHLQMQWQTIHLQVDNQKCFWAREVTSSGYLRAQRSRPFWVSVLSLTYRDCSCFYVRHKWNPTWFPSFHVFLKLLNYLPDTVIYSFSIFSANFYISSYKKKRQMYLFKPFSLWTIFSYMIYDFFFFFFTFYTISMYLETEMQSDILYCLSRC